jgi:hypothetical protein
MIKVPTDYSHNDALFFCQKFRENPMAKHTVNLEVPKRKISRSDVKFQVKADGKMLGTLTVSKVPLFGFLLELNMAAKWDGQNSTNS